MGVSCHMNRTQMGVPASTTLPVGVSFPVF